MCLFVSRVTREMTPSQGYVTLVCGVSSGFGLCRKWEIGTCPLGLCPVSLLPNSFSCALRAYRGHRPETGSPLRGDAPHVPAGRVGIIETRMGPRLLLPRLRLGSRK